ncbi:Endonuclease/Exonuclease/phosphatase family protein [Alteromonadaceae bacterium 2753L.S.0a.02]|nr:Endonuclease/Exonuclease/phosphatase family protein [Alteromonadaceae bacterium 2753L.S.0a.02]
MAIPFKEPTPPLRIRSADEISALDAHFDKRDVPRSSANRLLLASWNIANLGVQERSDSACKVIAHILKRFDLIAVQEINDDYRSFTTIVKMMGEPFNFIMSDTAGNDERLAYVYNAHKVQPGNLFGEVALRPREYPKRDVRVHYRKNRKNQVQIFKNLRYTPFDRNPFIGSFKSGEIDFVLANVHLYFGKFQQSSKEEDRLKYARRVLEIYALAKWANDRSSGGNAWDKDIVLLGDMNVPNMENNEATISALQQFAWTAVGLYQDSGLARTENLTRIGGSNLGNDKTYDQIAFAPTSLKNRIVKHGVFDFDSAVFSNKWRELISTQTHASAVKAFNPYLKRYLSDHRPIWVELRSD